MKVCVIQPYYSFDVKDIDYCFTKQLELLSECDDTLDLIVLPEYADIPADAKSYDDFHNASKKYNPIIMDAAIEAAKRCHAIVFVNAAYPTKDGFRNTTHAIDREGNIVGRYFKAHPAPSEVRTKEEGGHGVDVGYSYEFFEPYILELEGVRYAFLTCYDFYFYESFARIARENVDIIIGNSHQRTDTHQALSIINRFLCYNTNAYLLRSSVSLGEESTLCGCSAVIAPDGSVIEDMKSRVGRIICEIDPKAKYYKPAGHRGKLKSHYEYIEEGRRPWLYRNGGPSVTLFNTVMGYPRLCAHRGFNTVAPENSLPAFGEAIALGADEIEFDLWSTKDGVLVCCHDRSLDGICDGTGLIDDHTYEELLAFDFGAKYNEKYKGLKICTFEEILRKFAARVIMNIHVKIWDMNFPDPMIEKILSLVHKYDCENHVYFMTSNDEISKRVMEYSPNTVICVGWDGNKEDPDAIVKRAIKIGAKMVQLFKPYFNEETVKLAHDNGIICNVFYADEPNEARKYLEMGIDTVLTNDYLNIYNHTKDLLEKR